MWESETDASAWMEVAHPELDGRTPHEAAATEEDAARVEALLWRLFYGVPG
ncbi:antitoxin Xre/MbcA/ParS toxin-binding domain-containing protein [Paraburkholderia sp. BR10923]|uniref:antitoxin Xre/MbcA/ParS toxin-binding domain-containing protein n=1 Tax=Paraburkholderia sp. BR10923 TaxID=3236992 RepID=UPI0034CF197D